MVVKNPYQKNVLAFHDLNVSAPKYVVSIDDFVEANLASGEEVMDYFINPNSIWLDIYNNELKKSFPKEREKTLEILKKLIAV